MTEKPHNKKSPEGPQQSKRADPEYPWVSGSSDVNGRHKLIHADPSKPETSFVEEFNHDGSFIIHETLKDEKGLKNELYHHHRQYGQTKSSHHDGNHDIRAFNKSVVTDKDHGIQAGGDLYKGAGGHEVDASAKSSKTRKGKSSSKQQFFHSTSGDGSHLYEGNMFTFYGKDHGHAVDGSYYGMFAAEHGTYVQGNYDTHSDKKLKISSNGAFAITTSSTAGVSSKKDMSISSGAELEVSSKKDMSVSSGAELTISADTSITIKVGQSKIEIKEGSITITSAKIDFQRG